MNFIKEANELAKVAATGDAAAVKGAVRQDRRHVQGPATTSSAISDRAALCGCLLLPRRRRSVRLDRQGRALDPLPEAA